MEYVSPFVNVYGKTITMYHGGYPLNGDETIAYRRLLVELPPRTDCGIVLVNWYDRYTTQLNGIMIGLQDMSLPNQPEVLIPYNEFDMRNVPWDKLNPRGCV